MAWKGVNSLSRPTYDQNYILVNTSDPAFALYMEFMHAYVTHNLD